jgi:hypothetical protein
MLVSLSGLAAYLLLWASSVTGVATSSETLRRHGGGPWAKAPLHETLSLAGLGVALLHAAQSIMTAQGIRLGLLVFAGLGAASEWGLILGVAALYLTATATAAFYLRGQLGGWWHALHASAYLAYGAALWHALAIGANAWLPAVRWVYLLSVGVLAAVTVLRLSELAARRLPAPSA